ncbi:MAG: nucleotidyltransferase domain-containing protein [Polyangiaceae bacterium]|nr:nucleotidyltransferase domain-containing protein [Polyangiaceae bacterium]
MRSRFGARVEHLVLFGSEARGEAQEESDVDIAVVVAGLTSSEAREMDDVTGDLLSEFDVLVVPFAPSSEHAARLSRRKRLILREIERDGVAL